MIRLARFAKLLWRTMVPRWQYCKVCDEPYSPHAGRFGNLCRHCSRSTAALAGGGR
jgi:hypothetical protein